MKKPLLALVVVIILALGAGVYVWEKQENGQGVQEQSEQEDVVKTGASADIDTSDWKMYRNEEYGITFRYPETVVVKEGFDSAKILYIDIDSSSSLMSMHIVLNDLGTEKYWYAKKAGGCISMTVFGKRGETCGEGVSDREMENERYTAFVERGVCESDTIGAIFFEPEYSNKGINSMYVSCGSADGQISADVFHKIYQSVSFTR